MGRVRVLSGEQVVGIPEANGFVQVRQRGSHVVMQARLEDGTVTVPVPMHRELKLGTLLGIIRQSRLSRTCFEA